MPSAVFWLHPPQLGGGAGTTLARRPGPGDERTKCLAQVTQGHMLVPGNLTPNLTLLHVSGANVELLWSFPEACLHLATIRGKGREAFAPWARDETDALQATKTRCS